MGRGQEPRPGLPAPACWSGRSHHLGAGAGRAAYGGVVGARPCKPVHHRTRMPSHRSGDDLRRERGLHDEPVGRGVERAGARPYGLGVAARWQRPAGPLRMPDDPSVRARSTVHHEPSLPGQVAGGLPVRPPCLARRPPLGHGELCSGGRGGGGLGRSRAVRAGAAAIPVRVVGAEGEARGTRWPESPRGPREGRKHGGPGRRAVGQVWPVHQTRRCGTPRAGGRPACPPQISTSTPR